MGSYSPLTGKEIPRPISSIASAKLIADWMGTFGIDISQELEGIREIERYQCPDSRLFFFKPQKSCGSSALYEALGKFPWYYPKDKWEYQRTLKTVSKGSKIIEIGCGSGDFLDLAQRNHPEICGLDINPAAIAAASTKGLKVFCEGIEAFSRKRIADFDVLCAFQLLEHLSDPLDFLEDALRLVRRDGLLIFATPNAESFLRYQYTLLDMPPHHMSQWSAQAYRFLETILPVRVESLAYEPLSSSHIPHFAKSTADHLLEKLGVSSGAGSKIVEQTLCQIGAAGLLSPFVKGQGMLVVMRKIGDAVLSKKNASNHSKSSLANLGCGNRWHPDWRNIDLISSNPNVEAMNLIDEWDIPDCAFQVVYSSHVLEHIPRQEAPQFLKKCWRVLKPGGIVRIVVPDLESIARNYLASIERAETKTTQTLAEHEWMTLELLDQLVRTFSGGFMGRLWTSRPLASRELIIKRFGREAQDWIEKFESSIKDGKAPIQPKQVYEINETNPARETEFRRSGEIHCWMYDRISLENLLSEAGFSRISVKGATESEIPNFANYYLDSDELGYVRKPDSLFMEAFK